MSHDIIDNRREKLAEHIRSILTTTESARFAVGYFFLSGFLGIADRLKDIKELRLLIGNTTNQQTLELLVEGKKRLDLALEALEGQLYPKRTESQRIVTETAEHVRRSIELMDQTDEAEALLALFVRMIEEKRIVVKVYTKGRLHAKAYIFDYQKTAHHEKGIAVVGSSNLTLTGLHHNTELNVVVQGNENHADLVEWFENLWKEGQAFDAALMVELRQSWAQTPARPYDIYMKTLFALVKDRLEGDDEREILWDDEITSRLADFQKAAVRQALQFLGISGGVFVADVVGLGKSYIGAAIVKHMERTQHARPLIICPAQLVPMWTRYNEVYHLNAQVLSMGLLNEGSAEQFLDLDKGLYRERNFVLVDESHNFRYSDTQRYQFLQSFLATGRRCCFLTATPRNKSAWDVYYQIKLFHQEEKTELPVDPPNLKEYFKLIEDRKRKLQDLLRHLMVRRTRKDILRFYGLDAETHQKVDPARWLDYVEGKRKAYVQVAGKHQFFPKRELETIDYSIEETYQGLYQELRGYLGKPRKKQASKPPAGELTFARYGLWHYVDPTKQRREPYASLHRAGSNLHGLIRILFFKRFESSVYAFQKTLGRLLRIHEVFGKALEQGFVPAGEEAQSILYEADYQEETQILDQLRNVAQRYDAADFDLAALGQHIKHDVELLKKMQELVAPITPDQDAKLQRLKKLLAGKAFKEGKVLIFTQYADTARYLYDNLNPGNRQPDIDVVYSNDRDKMRIVGRFAPKANPEFAFQRGEKELNTLVATDVLAEGLNLQDCDKIVNYDLHWNPVRLIQRFGRIDRIGTEHQLIYGFNFLPETGIDRHLGLRAKLSNRIQEIHDTIGEDAAILEHGEQLNEEAMYAIYEQQRGKLDLLEEEDEFVDLNEAEEILRLLRSQDPGEFQRIAALRDGIRAGKRADNSGTYVFCQAGQYQQLFLLNENAEIISRDIPRILGTIKCGPEEPGKPLPPGHNKTVMTVKRLFTEEVKHREAERKHTLSLTLGQRYVLRELRIHFGAVEGEEIKGQINLMEQVFRASTTAAVNRELNLLRRNGVTGQDLLKGLIKLYHQHHLQEWLDRRALQLEEESIPRVICSEALG